MFLFAFCGIFNACNMCVEVFECKIAQFISDEFKDFAKFVVSVVSTARAGVKVRKINARKNSVEHCRKFNYFFYIAPLSTFTSCFGADKDIVAFFVQNVCHNFSLLCDTVKNDLFVVTHVKGSVIGNRVPSELLCCSCCIENSIYACFNLFGLSCVQVNVKRAVTSNCKTF